MSKHMFFLHSQQEYLGELSTGTRPCRSSSLPFLIFLCILTPFMMFFKVGFFIFGAILSLCNFAVQLCRLAVIAEVLFFDGQATHLLGLGIFFLFLPTLQPYMYLILL